MIPKKRMAIMTRLVMTGRRMKSVVTFMASGPGVERGALPRLAGPREPRAQAREPGLELVEIGVEHGGHVEGHDLGDGEAPYHHDPEGAARGGAGPDADRDRQAPGDRRDGRHHD